MAIAKKLYAVEFDGKTHLVRAQTTRGAVRGLVNALTRDAEKTARLLDANDMLNLALTGAMPRVIDVADDEPGATGRDAAQEQTSGAEACAPQESAAVSAA